MTKIGYKIIVGFILVTMLFSCKTDSKSEDIDVEVVKEEVIEEKEEVFIPLSESMIGNWETYYLKVSIDFDTDSANITAVKQEEIPEKLNLDRVEATYNEDGSFSSRYIAIDGSVAHEEIGIWYSKDAELFIEYNNEHGNNKYVYDAVVKNDTGFFKSMLDWDMDGNKDDFVELVSVKTQ